MIYTIKLNKIKNINLNNTLEYLELFNTLDVPVENHTKLLDILLDLQNKLNDDLLFKHGDSYLVIEV